MFTICPKCGNSQLPTNQALPAACPACGVILAKVAQSMRDAGDEPETRVNRSRRRSQITELPDDHDSSLVSFLLIPYAGKIDRFSNV